MKLFKREIRFIVSYDSYYKFKKYMFLSELEYHIIDDIITKMTSIGFLRLRGLEGLESLKGYYHIKVYYHKRDLKHIEYLGKQFKVYEGFV